jgi:hypothetical protein
MFRWLFGILVKLLSRPPLVQSIPILRRSSFCPNFLQRLIADTFTFVWTNPIIPASRHYQWIYMIAVLLKFDRSLADVCIEVVLPVFEIRKVRKVIDMYSYVGDFWYPIAAKFFSHGIEIVLTDPRPQPTIWKRKIHRSNSLK